MAKPYHWFQGASVAALQERLAEYANPKLIVRQNGDKMYLSVADGDGNDTEPDNDDDDNPINDSHRCPPDCP